MSIDFHRVRDCLHAFDFRRLFVDELGWSQPSRPRPDTLAAGDREYRRSQIAELAGVAVFEIVADDGRIPDARARAAVHKEVAAHHHENLLIFVDRDRAQSLWYWVKRDGAKREPREHLYLRGQPGDLFIGKLSSMVFELSDFDEAGNLSVVEVARRLRRALDIERVTRRFFGEFKEEHDAILELLRGIEVERDRQWYASVLLNRLMFVYFLQKKGFLDGGDTDYLQRRLEASRKEGPDRYYRVYLKLLFFEGFALPEMRRSDEAKKRLGRIPYLNGGLFIRHQIEQKNPDIDVPDEAFVRLFRLFGRYTWHLDDTPGGRDDEINPDVLGYIFEKYINQKEYGAYYTRPEITQYLCERTIHRLILDAVNPPEGAPALPGLPARRYETMGELLLEIDEALCRQLLLDTLPKLSILDPACGSGAFLVAAMKTLINVYSALVGRVDFFKGAPDLKRLVDEMRSHRSVAYHVRKKIITDNLFGVDVMEEATEIAKLRLFLALVAAVEKAEDLEPLPNIDFNILAGNSLIGLLHVNDAEFDRRHAQGDLFRKSYRQLVDAKDRLIKQYREAIGSDVATSLRDQIEREKDEARAVLDDILLDEFRRFGIKYEQATWDEKKKEEGKPKKRALTVADIRALHPFHWGYEFDEVLNRRGGFDAIITNPPWEVFQTDEKEFFQDYEPAIRKKNLRIEDWKKQFNVLMGDLDIRMAWLDYVSRYPHVAAYFKSSAHYNNQASFDEEGRKIPGKINLYTLFVEQCLNLLRRGGECGIVVPGGLYSDLGTRQLRDVLFSAANVQVLFGLSNEKFLFEGVDHRMKICLLVFSKGGRTEEFEAGFRINPREAISADCLSAFLNSAGEHVSIPVSLVREVSPAALSVPEFRGGHDLEITRKAARNAPLKAAYDIKFTTDFNMTTDSHLFVGSGGKGRLPLYEGKVIHQYDSKWGEPRYWLDEKRARAELLVARVKEINAQLREARLEFEMDTSKIRLDYEACRLAFRDVTRNTDERTMIATILPPRVFCPHTMSLEKVYTDRIEDGKLRLNVPLLDAPTRFYLLSLFNSFVVDFLLRQRVAAHVSFFFVYNLPIPRPETSDPMFQSLVKRAARLICTTPEFDELAKTVGLNGHKAGAVEPVERARLRAEIDGLVAHLYGLTEEEFAHVLATFPVVPDPVKSAARNAFRDVSRGLLK